MPRHRLSATAHSQARPSEIWSRLVDVEAWATWGPWLDATVDRPGHDADSAVGTVFTLMSDPEHRARFEVVTSDPDRRFAFEHWSGFPFHSYRTELALYLADDGGSYIFCETDVDVEPRAEAILTRDVINEYLCAVIGRLVLSLEREQGGPRTGHRLAAGRV